MLQLQVTSLISVLVWTLLEFKRPALDAFSQRGEVVVLVPMATNILFYDLEKPRAFGSPNQILHDTNTGFPTLPLSRENRDVWDPYLERRWACSDFPLWSRALTWSYTEKVSFQGEGKNSF
jgi:hypothetical protein